MIAALVFAVAGAVMIGLSDAPLAEGLGAAALVAAGITLAGGFRAR